MKNKMKNLDEEGGILRLKNEIENLEEKGGI
jgi:hypothetical protein